MHQRGISEMIWVRVLIMHKVWLLKGSKVKITRVVQTGKWDGSLSGY